ncbi:respiratory chain complex I subunit 1 family protein [Desulfotalea psychrophila]|uniref:Related to hydrogenase, component C-formate hydrogenlyase subunit 4 n=1 Tax=Desulfotalea psychrophila (strain LSv54 / DSM 12343) TaxID=177439 RepID=Q6APE9_DESPS|nr:NADH-quinone oxidoreductase subunit H [Desulfotalea psychrophila]CAG35775.1 related to hydrogenase, component C-formate hydrogenlyase subunit 4 [Desulfotalea psychrophila LSv54]
MESYISLAVAMLSAPLFPGIIGKVKAFFAGKQGPPLLIKYYTLSKLLKKGSVYSTSTSFIFKMGPTVSFTSALIVLLFFPFAGAAPLFSFHGDVIVLFYIMGIGRFFTVLAALDTASPFAGMGAAREVFFSTLAEITLFAVLILFYRLNGSLSFAEYFTGDNPLSLFAVSGALMVFVIVSLFMVLLTENSRVPVDDPQTHLELTMIHEAMILDHSGPDLALIELGAFYKLFFYSAFITHVIYPFSGGAGIVNALVFYTIMALLYVSIGVTESITARFKMDGVPKFILTSFALAFFAAILTMGVFQ